MTDLEITRLCAEAMGLIYPECVDRAIGPNIYDPLHDDAQAMALLKKFPIAIGRGTGYFVVEHWYELPGAERYETQDRPMKVIRCSNASLNRCICLCIAKMQLARKP